ncbi:hypothetical protein ACTFIR_004541 [Dictyostelium discoideum]
MQFVNEANKFSLGTVAAGAAVEGSAGAGSAGAGAAGAGSARAGSAGAGSAGAGAAGAGSAGAGVEGPGVVGEGVVGPGVVGEGVVSDGKSDDDNESDDKSDDDNESDDKSEDDNESDDKSEDDNESDDKSDDDNESDDKSDDEYLKISEIINKEGWGDQNDRKQLFKFYKSNLNSSKNSDGSSKPLITPLTSQNDTKILNRYVLNGEESLDDGERNYITDVLLKNKDEQSNPFRKLITENYNDKYKEAIQRIIIKGNSDRLKDIELMEKEFKLQDLINISNNLSKKQYDEIQTIRSEKLRLKLKDWLSFDKQTDALNIGENIKEIHSLEEILWSDKDGETNEQMKNRQINERSLIDAKSIMDSIVDDDLNVSNLLQQAEAINRVEHLKNDLKRKEHTIPMATRKKLSLHLIKVKNILNDFVVDGKELFITKELKSLDEDLKIELNFSSYCLS